MVACRRERRPENSARDGLGRNGHGDVESAAPLSVDRAHPLMSPRSTLRDGDA
jgi:hypothetical protein